jgi:hypothetical protein
LIGLRFETKERTRKRKRRKKKEERKGDQKKSKEENHVRTRLKRRNAIVIKSTKEIRENNMIPFQVFVTK